MKQITGFIIFILAVAFTSGLLATLILGAWYKLDSDQAITGFFGFAIPAFFTGLGTVILWVEHKKLTNLFILSSMFFSLLFGLGLISILINWLLQIHYRPIGISYFFAFGIPMIVLAFAAIIVLEGERSQKK